MGLLLLQAELQLNFQKRRGHGLLSVIRPKFSGMLGESLDIAARWSGDVVSSSFHIFFSCLLYNHAPCLALSRIYRKSVVARVWYSLSQFISYLWLLAD